MCLMVSGTIIIRLIPPSIVAKVLWEACDIALGQQSQLMIHFLPLFVGENTLHPKHNLDLYLEGQHIAKRLVLGVDESLVFHDDNAKHESDLSAACPLLNPYSSTNHLHAPGPFVHGRKSVPMGGTP